MPKQNAVNPGFMEIPVKKKTQLFGVRSCVFGTLRQTLTLPLSDSEAVL